jgi:hypothetical protein
MSPVVIATIVAIIPAACGHEGFIENDEFDGTIVGLILQEVVRIVFFSIHKLLLSNTARRPGAVLRAFESEQLNLNLLLVARQHSFT